ncbi:MAG TPA: helix-turn-helix domain-containing protein [Actinomycetota bacterium]
MQRSTIGVGSALRQVRSSRGLSLEEAARDTRIRREFLEAIERDDFDRLLGAVHVRGCLRTYASYLRLAPDKVVAAYEATRPDAPDAPDAPAAPAAPRPPAAPERALGAPRRRDNHRLVVMIAATVLVLAAAFGVLSARQPAPPTADLPSEAPQTVAEVRGIGVAVFARAPVEVTIIADGAEPETFALEAGEGRSFEADRSITVGLSQGATARITVSGKDLGYPGTAGRPWEETYSYRSPSATPSG